MNFQNAPEPDCLRKDAFGDCLPPSHETLMPHRGFYSHRKRGSQSEKQIGVPTSTQHGGVIGDPIVGPSFSDPERTLTGVAPKKYRALNQKVKGYYSYDMSAKHTKTAVPLNVQEKALDISRFYTSTDTLNNFLTQSGSLKKLMKNIESSRFGISGKYEEIEELAQKMEGEGGLSAEESQHYNELAESVVRDERVLFAQQRRFDATLDNIEAAKQDHARLRAAHRKALRGEEFGVGTESQHTKALNVQKLQRDVFGLKDIHDHRENNFEVHIEDGKVKLTVGGADAYDNRLQQLVTDGNNEAAIDMFTKEVRGGGAGTPGSVSHMEQMVNAVEKAVEYAKANNIPLEGIDIAGHSLGGWQTRILTPEIQARFPNLQTEGFGINAAVGSADGLPALGKSKMGYHSTVRDPTEMKNNATFNAKEAKRGVTNDFYPESRDAVKMRKTSLREGIRQSKIHYDEHVQNNLRNGMEVRAAKMDALNRAMGKFRDAIENNVRGPHDPESLFDERFERSTGKRAPADPSLGERDLSITPEGEFEPLNRNHVVSVDEHGNISSRKPSLRESLSSLKDINLRDVAHGGANFIASAGAGYAAGKVVEAVDPHRLEIRDKLGREAAKDINRGDIAKGIFEFNEAAANEAVHLAEYGATTGAIEATGRGLFEVGKKALISVLSGTGESVTPGVLASTGASAAASSFLPVAGAVAGGMAVSEGSKFLLDTAADAIGIDEDIYDPIDEIVSDAAGGGAGVAIGGAIATGMGYGAGAGPLGIAAGAAFGALVGGGIQLYKHWDDVSGFFHHLF